MKKDNININIFKKILLITKSKLLPIIKLLPIMIKRVNNRLHIDITMGLLFIFTSHIIFKIKNALTKIISCFLMYICFISPYFT